MDQRSQGLEAAGYARSWGEIGLDLESGPTGPCLAVRGPAGHPSLGQLRLLHGGVRHPAIPRLLDHGPGFVLLDVVPLLDGHSLWSQVAGDDELALSYPAGAAIGRTLALAWHAVHDQMGLALGASSWANVLFDGAGDVFLLACPPPPALAGDPGGGPMRAPEVAVGGDAVWSSDVWLLWALWQPLLAIATVPPEMVAALVGGSPQDSDYAAIFREVQQRAGASTPEARYPDLPTALDAWRRLWDALGMGPDEAAARSLVLAAAKRGIAPKPAPDPEPSVQVGLEARWLQLGDATVDLRRCPLLRRLVGELLRARHERPGAWVPLADLIAAGWPGEVILEGAARNRAWVALSRLRRLGLDELLLTDERGHQLDAAVRFTGAGWLPQ